jgi:hypothetical protein
MGVGTRSQRTLVDIHRRARKRDHRTPGHEQMGRDMGDASAIPHEPPDVGSGQTRNTLDAKAEQDRRAGCPAKDGTHCERFVSGNPVFPPNTPTAVGAPAEV